MAQSAAFTACPPERIIPVEDRAAGLRGVIVLHSLRLGPAAGGCRFWHYDDDGALHADALRLAEGMAYKNALADLPLGGGKSVLAVPDRPYDREKLFEAFGRAVRELEGDYITAEDVGTTVADMTAVRRATRHVAGLTQEPGRPGGDPSPWTARGVFLSMRVAARRRFGCDLDGLTVAVQGLGNVGSRLCELLHDAGAKLIVAEPRPGVAAHIACRYGAEVSASDTILSARADIFAPCALGGVLDADTVPLLRAGLVCGGANNVLATAEDGDRLAGRGVLYAPDYVVNAGGIIHVAGEYLGWEMADVARRVEQTGERLERVFAHADREGLPPARAADRLARERIARAPLPAERRSA
ncbi:Glu/Leu/Phe/Val family dehydrogenase [Stakelama tenebrarum]|uniref:Glu/Leu/Phe/Val dehydrogenase n=1 Tax=Stakelama tenebrarum TaxID=2711215 RepID=A0A6G6Y445_9SPHN|nr:Glu/Leu/Phe/Val dehydrogenase [Sphingosinithalassobacter tenebrarum]QIG79383.1 Glu/Leu/Phe/Val dehydrogenase [Sphingosinithalassobacter tenebrarum]